MGSFKGIHQRIDHTYHRRIVNTKYAMSIMKNLGDKQSLLIYCKKNQADMILPENVEVKKYQRIYWINVILKVRCRNNEFRR